jgi:UDP-N-acetyl-D-glucosamine dehydrogenase
LAAEINENMPDYVLEKIVSGLNSNYHSVNGAKVLVIGVAYKANVNDVRESPALELIEMLAAKGADVSYHDSYVPSVRVGDVHYKTVPLDIDRLESADCVLIHTAHDDIDWQFVADHTRLVVDTRNAMARTRPSVARVVKL